MTNSKQGSVIGQRNPVEEGFTVPEFFTILLHRWWLVVIAAGIGLAAGVWYDRQQVSVYTAHGMLQRRTRPNAQVLGIQTLDADPLNLASEIQILRSRAVIATAVDSFGLRLRFGQPAVQRNIIDDAHVEPQAPSGHYLLAAEGNDFTLRTGNGRLLGRAQRGQELNVAGLRLHVRNDARRLSEPAEIDVTSNDAAVKKIQGALGAENEWGESVIKLSVRDNDPSFAARALNGVATAYIWHDGQRSRSEARRRESLVEGQLLEVRDSLNAARRDLLEYQSHHGTVDATDFTTRLAGLEDDNHTLRYQISVLDGIAASLRSSAPIDDAFRRVVVEGAGFLPTGEALYTQLRQFQTERQKLTAPRFGYTEAESRVQLLDSLIQATRTELLAIAEQASRLRSQQLVSSNQRITQMRGQMALFPEQNATNTQLLQRVEAAQKTFDMLTDKNYETHIASEVASGDVDFVDQAIPPSDPDPSSRKTLLLGLAIGLLAGIGLAFVLENMDGSVRRSGDVERATGLPVLALIPRGATSARKSKRRTRVTIMDDARAAESFRLLRTALRFMKTDGQQVIAVTSARPREGKSTIAANLGVSHAQLSGRVLLIDADLRRPALHGVLELSRGPGLSDVLNGTATLDEVIRPTQFEGLWLVSCGSATSNPAEILGGEGFRATLAQCRERFDTIIVDTPPVLPVADAALVGSVADAVILVARAGETNRYALAHATGELHKVNVPLLGVVLNAAPTIRTYGRYSMYSSYYHFDKYSDDYYRVPKAAGK